MAEFIERYCSSHVPEGPDEAEEAGELFELVVARRLGGRGVAADRAGEVVDFVAVDCNWAASKAG